MMAKFSLTNTIEKGNFNNSVKMKKNLPLSCGDLNL